MESMRCPGRNIKDIDKSESKESLESINSKLSMEESGKTYKEVPLEQSLEEEIAIEIWQGMG